MATIHKLAGDSKAVILYSEKDIKGRQRLIARKADGNTLFECRRVKSMAGFLKRYGLKFYEYVTLPKRTRKALTELRAAKAQEIARQDAGDHFIRPTLADVWPK